MAPSRERSSNVTPVHLGPVATGGIRKSLGRPPMAKKVWTRRNLGNAAKLYYCTDLTVEIIGTILSALATPESGAKLSNADFRSLRSSTYQQMKAFGLDRQARPKSRDVSRARLFWMKVVRSLSGSEDSSAARAFQKHHLSVIDIVDNNLHMRQNSSAMPESRPSLQDQSPASFIFPSPPDHLIDNKEASAAINVRQRSETQRQRRYSLLRNSVLSLESRPTSSVLAEILSLLSSPRSSIFSERSCDASEDLASSILNGATRGISYALPDYQISGGSSVFTRLLTLSCCQNRPDCLHRRVWTILDDNRHEGQIEHQYFQYKTGRDIFGNTAVHIAVEWSAPIAVVVKFVKESCDELMNVTNINGDSFMHALGPLFIGEEPHALLDIICSVDLKGFDWELPNRRKDNFFAALLPEHLLDAGENEKGMSIIRGLELLLLHMKPESLTKSLRHQIRGGEIVESRLLNFLSQQSEVWREAGLHCQAGFATLIHNSYLAAGHVSNEGHPMLNSVLNTEEMVERNPLFSLSLPMHRKDLLKYVDLLAAGWSPNDYNSAFNTFIMHVIHSAGKQHISEKNAMTILSHLSPHNVDLRLVDHFGNTALHHATIYGLESVVGRLIALGAEAPTRNAARLTPLDLFIARHINARKGKIWIGDSSYMITEGSSFLASNDLVFMKRDYSTSIKALVGLFDAVSIRKRSRTSMSAILTEAAQKEGVGCDE